jgi:hypothetical protein
MSGALPHNLREVAPVVEVRHIRVSLTVQAFEIGKLVVVHQVGDHGPDVVGVNTVTNVLAISASVDVTATNKSDSTSEMGAREGVGYVLCS